MVASGELRNDFCFALEGLRCITTWYEDMYGSDYHAVAFSGLRAFLEDLLPQRFAENRGFTMNATCTIAFGFCLFHTLFHDCDSTKASLRPLSLQINFHAVAGKQPMDDQCVFSAALELDPRILNYAPDNLKRDMDVLLNFV